jgi:hypothetical protein
MNEQQVPQQTAREGVNWWAVLGGIVVALVMGVIAGAGGGLLGMAITTPPPRGGYPNFLPFIMGTGFVLPLLVLGVTWYFSRKRLPSFAKGIIVGGCLAILVTGFCNMLFGMLAANPHH